MNGAREIRAKAWGSGAAWALDHAPGLVGAEDDDSGFRPRDDLIANLWRRHRGVRITRNGAVLATLLGAVFEQKVTGQEARRAWRRLVSSLGEPAPGPEPGLLLPPDPARVAELPYFSFHPFGVERRRAELIRWICAHAAWVESCANLSLDDAKARLESISGIGPWTVAEVARLALGDPDAVSIGDFHLPNIVAWALAGEARGDDARMLELLEPYRGQRGRVQVLLEAGGIAAPRFGPRMEPRSIERM